MSENGNLQFHQMVFRCGWATKNLHTAFDYIFNSVNKDSVCGKVLANWTTVSNGCILGSIPPTASSVCTNEEKMLEFIKLLYHHQIHIQNETIKKLLVGSILLWEDDFIDDIQKLPEYESNILRHPFMAFIQKTKVQAGIVQTEWEMWKKEVKGAYVSSNFNALPLHTIKSLTGDDVNNVLIDGRTVVESLSDIGQAVHNESTEVKALKTSINKMSFEITEVKSEFQYMKNKMNDISDRINVLTDILLDRMQPRHIERETKKRKIVSTKIYVINNIFCIFCY